MAQTVSVIVPAEDRERLLAIIGDRNRPLKHVQRAKIILFSAERLRVLEVARAELGRYLHFYNSQRPHSSLDRRTPDEAYFNRPAIAKAA
jgi:transposase InsO family protein